MICYKNEYYSLAEMQILRNEIWDDLLDQFCSQKNNLFTSVHNNTLSDEELEEKVDEVIDYLQDPLEYLEDIV